MTTTITSPESGKRYQLTIDDEEYAADCSCPDRNFRHHDCKHITRYDAAFDRAAVFAALFKKYDYRANGDLVTHRINFEITLGF